MLVPIIIALLDLQDRDTRCDTIKHKLAEIPAEVAELETEVKQAQAELDAARQALKDLEVQRKTIEGQIAALEEQVVKFKTQQMAVKKQEEYQAFNQQIEHAQQGISQCEDQEIEVLMAIDDKRDLVANLEKTTAETIARLKGEIGLLRQNEAGLRAELGGAEAAVATAETAVPAKALSVYKYVKTRVRKGPYVVPIVDHKCMGCHLKVSNDVLTITLRDAASLPRCDSCSRIVYAGKSSEFD